MGDVPRTDALWNKLACPREPTGSLSEAIYSPHTQRLTAGPASRASGWPPNRGRERTPIAEYAQQNDPKGEWLERKAAHVFASSAMQFLPSSLRRQSTLDDLKHEASARSSSVV